MPIDWLGTAAAALESLAQAVDAMVQSSLGRFFRWLTVAALMFTIVGIVETVKPRGRRL